MQSSTKPILCILLVVVFQGNAITNSSFHRKPVDEEFDDSYIDSICAYEQIRYVNGIAACREDYQARRNAIRAENARLRNEVDSLKAILKVSKYTEEDFNYFQGYCTGGDTTVRQIERALHVDPKDLIRTTALRNLKYTLEDAVHCPGIRRVLEYALSKPVPKVSDKDLSSLTLETTGSLIDGQYLDTSDVEIYFVYLLYHDDIQGTVAVEEYRRRIKDDPFLLLLFEYAQELRGYVPTDSTLVRIAGRINEFSEANVAKVFGHGYSNVASQILMAAYSRFKATKFTETSSDSTRVASIRSLLSDDHLVSFYRMALTKGPTYNRNRSLPYLKDILEFIGRTEKDVLNGE